MFDNIKNLFFRKKEIKQDRPFLNEQAWANNNFFSSSIPFEEYNIDELAGRKGPEIYKKMFLDPQVKAAYDLLVDIIISRNWLFETVDDSPRQQEIKEFLEFNITQSICGTFQQALKAILLAKAHGFSVSEKNYFSSTHLGKPRWLLQSIKAKNYADFSFVRDTFGNVISIIQDQNGRRKKLNPQKFIHYVNYPEYDPIWGISDLRAAYRAYWEKSNILNFWNIYLERLAGGFVVVKSSDSSVGTSGGEKEDLRNVLRNISAHTAITLPAGMEADVIHGPSTSAFEDAVSHRDRQIAKALLVPNLLGFSDQRQTGSFAQSKTQLDTFFFIVNFQGDVLADVLNEQLFRELTLWNFGEDEVPRFKFDAFTEAQKTEIAKAWGEAIEKGSVINTFEDELRTRELLNYGAREEDAEPLIPEEPEQSKHPEEPEKKAKRIGPPDPEPSELRAPAQEKKAKEGSKKTFAEQPTALDRVDFVEIGNLFDKTEKRFFEELSRAVDKMFSEVESRTREIYSDLKKQKSPNVEATLKRLDNAVSASTKSQMNKVVQSNLRRSYDGGRKIAQDEISGAASKTDEEFSERLIIRVKASRRRAVKYSPELNWTVRDFVEGIATEDVEKLLSASGFHITGTLNDDLLKAARQSIIQGIENDKSINDMVNDLSEIVSPLIGKVQIDPITAKPVIDKEERARIETIVRTNVNSVFNQAQLSVFTDPELGDFVEAFEYTSVLDRRTTQFCRRYDGFTRPKTAAIWGSITPPNHFNCRARLIAITAVDEWSPTKNLPKDKEGFVAPGKGFGTIKESFE